MSSDVLYKLIKARQGKDMRAVIGAGLNYKDISNASPDMRKIVQATTTALRAIGEESKLNEIRVRKYGIASDPASTKSENGEGA